MKQVRFYIEDLYHGLYDMLNKTITENVFVEHRPSGLDYQMSDFVIVSLPANIVDQRVYQHSIVRFEIAARNKQSGIANTAKLQSMLDKLVGLFPIRFDRFVLTSPSLLFKGDDENSFTIWLVQADLVVNTTDRLSNESK